MIPSGARAVATLAVVAWLAAAPNLVAQDTLARAKDLYNTAAYDEALLVLNRLRQTASSTESTEIAGYQAFCLLALGRTLDARQAIAALVKSDPLYRLSESSSSPRTRAVFDEIRRELLPTIVQQTYDQAKAAYDRKEPDVAVREFDRVLALLDEPGLSGLPNMEDLRRLATGFRDLSKAAATPPPPAVSNVPGSSADSTCSGARASRTSDLQRRRRGRRAAGWRVENHAFLAPTQRRRETAAVPRCPRADWSMSGAM